MNLEKFRIILPGNLLNFINLQRGPADSQSSPNYNHLHSPIGVPVGQISPGQRISQPAFSPSQIGSPISNSQQYQNR